MCERVFVWACVFVMWEYEIESVCVCVCDERVCVWVRVCMCERMTFVSSLVALKSFNKEDSQNPICEIKFQRVHLNKI